MTTTDRPLARLVLAHVLAVLTLGAIAVELIAGIVAGDPLEESLPFLVLLLVTLLVGWLLTFRLPRHPVGWILMAVPALFASDAPLNILDSALGTSAPVVSRWIAWYDGTDANPSWSWLPPVWLLLSLLPLRFPTGRLPSPRWRWFERFSVAVLVGSSTYLGTVDPTVDGRTPNPVFIPAVDAAASALYPVVFALLAASFVVSIASLFVRYRSAAERERAQLRWMMWAVPIAVAGLLLGSLVPDALEWVQTWLLLLYALIPLAVAVAVLRYRLYEIDRIISRTAAYAVLTVAVVATYALVVLLVSLVLPHDRQDQTPPVVVAVATLAAAGVCLPALRWIRRGVDRVFNRSQYDAERVVVAFGERIRNGADPHTAGRDLVGAVGQTLQPSAIGLWVREGAR